MTAKDGLDASLAGAADLEKQTDDLAQQFAVLGNEGSAQVSQSARERRLDAPRCRTLAARSSLTAS